MGPETFALFRASYAENPARTKDRFHALIAKGDADGKRIMTKLRHHPDVENTARWLPWLDALASYSLADASLARSPRTLIIHGMNDAIVPLAQSEILLAKLPRATLQRWEQTGHAPHLHDAARLRAAIAAHRAAT
jgi:pimeloyl-ACP methyl ester carboxylesterase